MLSKQEILEIIEKNEGHPERFAAGACRRNYYHFLQAFWPKISSEDPVWNWHIKYIYDELQAVAERVMRREPVQRRSQRVWFKMGKEHGPIVFGCLVRPAHILILYHNHQAPSFH